MLLETLHSPESVLAQMDTFSTGKLELWFQPVYQTATGAVLHNEILLRWRDEAGNLHLPQEFLPTLSDKGQLQKADRAVIRKGIELLAEQPDRCLSINLSGEGLNNFELIEYIETLLDQSGVDPKQLSFELTESTIAKDFPTIRAFVRELKSLGCAIVLDNFASRELTLFQCQQLAVDLVKVDGQLIQRLKTEPNSRVLTKAILEGIQALSQVAAKFVSDAVTLSLVEDVGIDLVQGHHLKTPSPAPDWTELVRPEEEQDSPTAEVQKSTQSWRFLVGTGFVLLGLGAVGVGIASIGYRLSHLVVDGGTINGRIVRLQAPTTGNIQAFYAQPGVVVKSGQLLARISQEPSPQEQEALLRLERAQEQEQIRNQLESLELQGQIQVNATQLASAKQSLALLKTQLQQLERRDKAVRQVDVELGLESIKEQQAVVQAAQAKAEAARLDYQRYQTLLEAGGVSAQETDQLRLVWQSAQAEVQQAQSVLDATQKAVNAAQAGIARSNRNNIMGGVLSDQRISLQQTIQQQSVVVNTMEAQLAKLKQQQNNSQSLQKNAPSLVNDLKQLQSERKVQNVSAPFAGVVYTAEREQGEQVNQLEPIVTLLDCNNLWVETVVSAEQASSINTDKPVTVGLAGYAKTVKGEIDLIQPISNMQQLNKLTQVQALQPAIPPKLVGQQLTRITVQIPPPPQHDNSQQFCGLGQAARLTFPKKLFGNR